MVQQLVNRTSDTLPPPPDAIMCDRDPSQVAVFAYRWEWGETGNCCAEQATLLQQTAQTLQRSIALHPLQAAAPPPLTRDERTQLVARSLVLEAELEEAKTAGLETYRRNGDLQVQLNSAIVKTRELSAQVDDLRHQLSEGENLNQKLSSENGTLLVELQRLRSLETFVNERAEREGSREGDAPHVVDG